MSGANQGSVARSRQWGPAEPRDRQSLLGLDAGIAPFQQGGTLHPDEAPRRQDRYADEKTAPQYDSDVGGMRLESSSRSLAPPQEPADLNSHAETKGDGYVGLEISKRTVRKELHKPLNNRVASSSGKCTRDSKAQSPDSFLPVGTPRPVFHHQQRQELTNSHHAYGI